MDKKIIDIGYKSEWPASALSNFAAHRFVIDGVVCESMEGFLQSLKFEDPEVQEKVCKLVGVKAKYRGKRKKWWLTQTLWWRGKKYDRHGKRYQKLLDRAYLALSKNKDFRKALLATGDATLIHSIGKTDPYRTILTEQEFCSRLEKIRELISKRRKKEL